MNYNKIIKEIGRGKAEASEELLGFYQAMQEQVMALQAPASLPTPIVIPSYNGAR